MKEELKDSKELKEFSANLKELNEEELAQVNGGIFEDFIPPFDGGC